uniref:Tubulin-specific chaperone A n=1 Tax=Aegilops tauschii TaxID=37682 RepID=N1R3T5_AEGTA
MAATLRSLGTKTRTCRRAMRVENVLAESRMMIPDCHKRLEATLAELEATLAELKESEEQGVEIGEAETVITEVETVSEQFEDKLTSQERRGRSHEKWHKPQQAQA